MFRFAFWAQQMLTQKDLFHLYSKHCSRFAIDPSSVSKVFWRRPKRFLKLSLTYSRNSLYFLHQNTPKPCFTTISVFRWNSCGLSISLRLARWNLQKTVDLSPESALVKVESWSGTIRALSDEKHETFVQQGGHLATVFHAAMCFNRKSETCHCGLADVIHPSPVASLTDVIFALCRAAVRNDRNKRRGKEKDAKNGSDAGSPVAYEEVSCTPEIESLIHMVSKFHIDTFPLTDRLNKYNVVRAFDPTLRRCFLTKLF